ncbi:MAG: hypothetical protein WC661_22110 [Opitutaceae bacterium]|jgi:hypothetical protein
MSAPATNPNTLVCPVCRYGKAEAWHLVCPSCWSRVPADEQHTLQQLRHRERGSPRHRHLCQKIVRNLFEKKRAFTRPKNENHARKIQTKARR